MKLWRIETLLLIFLIHLFKGSSSFSHLHSESLWFTGPLLELTPVSLAPLQPAIEPVIVLSSIYGNYKSGSKVRRIDTITSFNPIMEFKIGLFPETELKAVCSGLYQTQNHKSSCHFQDSFLYFGYRIFEDEKDSYIPDLSIFIQLTIPTGKFDQLHPQKLEIDATGQGALQYGPALSYRKIFHLSKSYFILYGNLIYLFSEEAHIKGYNVYGGGIGTKGRIRPGEQFYLIVSGEYLFNQNWGCSCDIEFFHQQKTSCFKGTLGSNAATGIKSSVGLPSSYQLSLTPAIEYNCSDRCGVYGGIWFTALGKNQPAFTGGFAALVYLF